MTKQTGFVMLLCLLAPGCDPCGDPPIVEFTLDAEHPTVLIRASAPLSETPQILYFGEHGWLQTDAQEGCRVAVYNYGEASPSEWPTPGTPPVGDAVIDLDFLLDADTPVRVIGQDIIPYGQGPTEGTLLITSCGTAEIHGRLTIFSCVEEGEHLDIDVLTSPP